MPANPFCAFALEPGFVNVTLDCLNGSTIDALPLALYGLQSGACPDYEPSPVCNLAAFAAYAAATCIGQRTCTLSAASLPDPCFGTVKSIAVVAHCSAPPGGYSPDGYVSPTISDLAQSA